MIKVTSCENCDHKEICAYVNTLDNISEVFKNEFRGCETSTIFDVKFECRKYREKVNIRKEVKNNETSKIHCR